MKSDPKRNSVLTRSVLVDMFPKKVLNISVQEKNFNISLSKNIQTAPWGADRP